MGRIDFNPSIFECIKGLVVFNRKYINQVLMKYKVCDGMTLIMMFRTRCRQRLATSATFLCSSGNSYTLRRNIRV